MDDDKRPVTAIAAAAGTAARRSAAPGRRTRSRPTARAGDRFRLLAG